MNRAIAANGIKPAIDKVFGFDEIQAASKHIAWARTSAIAVLVLTQM
jgi:NADPH:quinone reductase-like Zn-dependent oxidoreductase